MKTCFFLGHRDAPEEVRGRLAQAVERHITEYGVMAFTVGHYGSFDRMAAEAVIDAKKRHPEVTLYLLLPYHSDDHPISAPRGFDGAYYPPGLKTVPKRAAIVWANRFMVDSSDHLIAYLKHFGNTRDLVTYAQERARRGLIHITLL